MAQRVATPSVPAALAPLPYAEPAWMWGLHAAVTTLVLQLWRWRRIIRVLVMVTAFVMVPCASMYLAVVVTKPSTIQNVIGQTLKFEVAKPNFTLSGPGLVRYAAVDLPTLGITFPGPIRPVLSFPSLVENDAVSSQFTDLLLHKIPPWVLQAGFIDGGLSYFGPLFLNAVVAVVALWALVAVVMTSLGIVRRWRHTMQRGLHWVRRMLVGTVLVSLAILGGSTWMAIHAGLTAGHDSLTMSSVVGDSPLTIPPPVAHPDTNTEIAILGDSVPAGNGLTEGPNPTELDKACGRSPASYSGVLQDQLGMKVANLGCGSAKIFDGIYTAQHNRPVPPQLSELEAMKDVKLINLNVGADDIEWSHMFVICYAQAECDDNAVGAFFKTNLDRFRVNEEQLMHDINVITDKLNHQVVKEVNLYYNPFTLADKTAYDCLSLVRPGINPEHYGITREKAEQMTGYMNQLNDVIRQSAKAFGFRVVEVNFSGHELCNGVEAGILPGLTSPTQYIQGLDDVDGAPLHPTAAGHMAIALAMVKALPENWDAIAAGLAQPETTSSNQALGISPSMPVSPALSTSGH